MKELTFPHPEPRADRPRIWPVFLPFQGCRNRCVFCAQAEQSGVRPQPLSAHFDQLEKALAAADRRGQGPFELGFFGGSFTGLPAPWPERFLELARSFRRSGLIGPIRCSTRPDMLGGSTLDRLRQSGLDLVEIGVQTFSEDVLQGSGRGYSAAQIWSSFHRVRQAGLGLGVQLLPGLPGHSGPEWRLDVATTVAAAPDVVRIYPCQVLQGTELARRWQRGDYSPWGLPDTVSRLARGVFALWRRGIRVIRMGLPPQPELTAGILAGPWHPSLGSMVRGRILRARVQAACFILGPGPKRLVCPAYSQGDIWGFQAENRPALASFGLSRGSIGFADTDHFRLEKI